MARTKKRESFSRYDSADYLRSPEEVVQYLIAAFEEAGDDPAYMAHVIGNAARAARRHDQAREKTGITRAGLHKALSRDRQP